MVSHDVFVVSASYDRGGGDVVVEMFGRTREGRSITVLWKGFKPYFHVVKPSREAIEWLKGDPEIISIEDIKLWHKGSEMDAVKVTLKSPWKVPQYRRHLQSMGHEVLAADIPFHHRFFYDMDLGPAIRVEGEDVTEEYRDRYTTDIVLLANSVERIDHFRPRLKILSFDLENLIEDERILVAGVAITEGDGIRTMAVEGESEREIITKLLALIREEDPDVITGYNIDGYDIPLLQRRAKVNGVEFALARDWESPTRVMERAWRAHGRVVVDAWWAVKKELKPKQETLNAVSMELLGESKMDVEAHRIREEWERDRKKVTEYCVRDAELALRILLKLRYLDKVVDLAGVSLLPMDDVHISGSSTLIDSILIRRADREGIGVPLMKHGRQGGGKIEGGYVHSIEPGLYRWVVVMDFKSMYPSIIIKYNICFTTISEDGEIESPIGVRFVSPERRRGLVPRILEELMKKRDELKRRMKEAKTEEERDYYDGLQRAVKVLMNSFYGVFASSFYRFTNKDIGASITAFARETTKSIIRELEAKGIRVVYGDTDSVFFESPEKSLEGAVKWGRNLAKEFSEKMGLVLEFEKVFDSFFSHGAKKRYVGKVAYPPEERGKLVVRGYETRRTDAFDLQSEALMEVFRMVLDGDLEGAERYAKEIVEKVKKGEVPIEKLVISRSVASFDSYKNPNSLPHVQAAKKLIARGHQFVPGMKVSWIVVNSRRTPQEVEPYIPGEEFRRRPDYEYYARRVAETLSRVLEALRVDRTYLLTGAKQMTLGGFTGEKKSKKKGKTLFDFV